MSRMTATDPVTSQACELDVLLEVFTSPPEQTGIGPVLSLDDTIGLKTRAAHDRGFPRDLIDVYSARHLYSTLEMELLGAQHEDDFDLEELHARLEAAEFTHDREFTAYGMALDDVAELRRWVKDWADNLGVRLAAHYDEESQ